jgi:hypothetical protein
MDVEDNPKDDGTDIQADKPAPPPKRADSIQVEKPVPPWERPGYFRLDCEPHRAGFLTFLALVSLFAGALSSCPIPHLIPISLPLAAVTWRLACADLEKMEKGLMDPCGELWTDNARQLSRTGLLLSVFGSVSWSLVALFAWLGLT